MRGEARIERTYLDLGLNLQSGAFPLVVRPVAQVSEDRGAQMGRHVQRPIQVKVAVSPFRRQIQKGAKKFASPHIIALHSNFTV